MNLKDMTVGVIGGGVVGQATARTYLEHVKEVRVYDTERTRLTHSIHETLESDVVFVCLPETALDPFFTGRFNTKGVNYVIKSTCAIGTTRRLAEQYQLTNLVHSPEFLTARCATVDAQLPTRNIVGYPAQSGKGLAAITPLTALLLEFYEKRFPGVPAIRMSSDESEAVKLFVNGFFAVKVAYWNEVHQLATTLGLDWSTIINAVLGDGRIHPSHTQVPGPDGNYGFGGKCLPKDLDQLIECLSIGKVDKNVCSAVKARNAWDRRRAT